MSRDGYLPPGCTQQECDEAQPGYWDPPQRWYECDACAGEGYTVHRITVYELGCGFPHDDSDERQCGKCNGAGGWMDDDQPDDEMHRALAADGEKLRQLTGEDHGPFEIEDECPF
jgi:hypothetical protein